MRFANTCVLFQLLAATLLVGGQPTEGFFQGTGVGTIRKTHVVTAVATSIDGTGSKVASAISRPEKKSAETRRLLEELDSLPLDKVKLNDVENLLNEQLPYGCIVDRKSLEEEGIDAALVICHWSLANASLGTMLEMVLDNADLTYRIQDGILVITTNVSAQNHLELAVYDAKELFDSVVVVEPHMVEDVVVRQLLNQRLIGEPIGDLDAVRVVLDKYVDKFGPRADELRYNRVCGLIESLVDPDSWENNGGTASLSSVGKRLIVRNTERTHRKIRKLLDDIEKNDN
ncbi:MAG: hypothetical protein Q8M16_06860 [Pirellulaceae bacterium]|nr:hypothetical protein [Pirellulaceae bacterium]